MNAVLAPEVSTLAITRRQSSATFRLAACPIEVRNKRPLGSSCVPTYLSLYWYPDNIFIYCLAALK
jgi:hypothetical protein